MPIPQWAAINENNINCENNYILLFGCQDDPKSKTLQSVLSIYIHHY